VGKSFDRREESGHQTYSRVASSSSAKVQAGTVLAKILEEVLMATITGTTAAAEALGERLTPAFEALEENIRNTRRAVADGRHAAEDFVAEKSLLVRRHPVSAVALAAGAGAVIGCLFGFVIGRRTGGPSA
jgi:ElaB/YqjD/DUF883 family membrane-anchored ribosome-binding protein